MKYRKSDKETFRDAASMQNNIFFWGVLAGLAGTTVQTLLERPLVMFHVIDSGIMEHAEAIIMGQDIPGYPALFVGLIGHLLYSALWGGAFGLLITRFPGRRLVCGTGMGLTAWIFIMFITTLLRQHKGGGEEALHALILLLGGAVYGLATAWFFGWLSKKYV